MTPGVAAAFPDVLTHLFTYILTYLLTYLRARFTTATDELLTRHRRLIFLVVRENSPDYF